MTELLNNFWFLLFGWLAVTSVAATLAQAWHKVRRADREAALKKEMLQRGLSVEEMERVLRASAKPQEETAAASADDEAIEELVTCLAACESPGHVIEQVLAAVRATEPSLKQAICRAVQALVNSSGLEGEARDEQILAVVRGLCPPDAPPLAPALMSSAEPVIPPRPDETFQLNKPA
jgi:hypothetical protein